MSGARRFPVIRFSKMDGRAKKRMEIIKQKLQLLRQKLSGAKRQDDEPGEVRKLEQEIAALEAEAIKLKG
jgi:polyhydroxyalkanoate synthesis regulator phasin